MKRSLIALLAALLALPVIADTRVRPIKVSDLTLEGRIDGENISFSLALNADVKRRNVFLPLVVGDVAYLDGTLPRRSQLVRENDKYHLKLNKTGKQDIRFEFASRAAKDGEWRHTSFSIPSSDIRKISVICDRDDLEIRFPGALDVKRSKVKDKDKKEKTRVTAYLGISSRFEVRWKPEVKKLESELVASCDANSIVTASVGALRLDTVFTYRVIQGRLNKLSMKLPGNVSVTQVRGDDIQDWRIDKEKSLLLVTVSRPKETLYRLQVESEMILPKFPCSFTLPVVSPQNVLRTSGFLMVGTDSAIKLKVDKAAGLTQVDPSSFPQVYMSLESDRKRTKRNVPLPRRARPSKSIYAYQYANTPYTLNLSADDIVQSFTVDDILVLSLADNELTFKASVQLDIKDAPARELLVEVEKDSAWTVTGISGQQISEADTDIREENDKRIVYIPFKKAVVGTSLVEIQMERTLKPGVMTFRAPKFKVLGARSERGFLIVAAEKGVRLKLDAATGFREIHTGSAPRRVPGAQQAFRFKRPEWGVEFSVERAVASVHSEVFHLVSLGEGVMYCSAAITYHIGGAPVQEFHVRVPKKIKSVEFTGADIEGWTRDGDVCTVRLQSKLTGDYILLATYDSQYDPDRADITVAGIETIGTESEVGYVALASASSVSPRAAKPLPTNMSPINREEIPSDYSDPVEAPIVAAYKYTSRPHQAVIHVAPYPTEQLMGQVADYVKMKTTISKDGESVTTVNFYVKNAHGQYLEVSLPHDAKLWWIKSVDEKGQKEKILSQRAGDKYLIPIRRLRDPDTPQQVELVYAESVGALGFWTSGVRDILVSGPAMPDTHATFAEWDITVPDTFTISEVKGNMQSTQTRRESGLKAVIMRALDVVIALFDSDDTVQDALIEGWGGRSKVQLTRLVSLRSELPPTVRVAVVPDWVGSESSVRSLLLACLLGISVWGIGVRKRKGMVWNALAGTLVIYGVAQCALGRSVLALLLVLLVVGIFVAKGGLKWTWRMVQAVFRIVFSSVRFLRSRQRIAKPVKPEYESEQEVDDLEPFEVDVVSMTDDDIKQDDHEQGFISLRYLFLILIMGISLSALASKPRVAVGLGPVMDHMEVTIDGPGMGHDEERSADVTRVFEFKTETPTSFVVVPSTSVLKDYELNSRYLEIRSRREGYLLDVKRAGKYKVTIKSQSPVIERDGEWHVSVYMLGNMKNTVTLRIPENGLDVQSEEAVLFKTEDNGKQTMAEAVFGPTREASFKWRPRVRKTTLEEAVFFCEVNGYIALRSGVIDLTNLIRYQIAQGEIKELKVNVPEEMTVTAVHAPNLATWSFDPETRLLEAILNKAVSGDFTLLVKTQVSCEGLPYKATMGALNVLEATRQRGSVALAAPDTIQVRVGPVKGLNPMNIEDFSSAAVHAASVSCSTRRKPLQVRRSFRYHQAEQVALAIETERVLPEIRALEDAALSIADERIMLRSALTLSVLKAGIFSVTLGIPGDFDVETLTGRDVSHWDELGDEKAKLSAEEVRRIKVHFNRQIQGSTMMNLGISRMEKGVEERIVVPRVVVVDAKKHKGKLTVEGEAGIRLMVANHVGVDIKKTSEEGIRQAGVLVFDILRPNWSIDLKASVMAPVVKSDVLQVVDLSEGMLKCESFVRYKIENAGVKSFQLQSPVPSASLSVHGRRVARVHLIDKKTGLWQVDLHSKVMKNYQMNVSYQISYDQSTQKVALMPLRTIHTSGQTGYLVIRGGGRVQVKDIGGLAGLKIENPRTIPSYFKAGDLSDAIKCYKTVRPDYKLLLSVVRHDAADVLPASIDSMRVTSVMSTSRRLLTEVQLSLTVGDLRLLKVALPNSADKLWTARVNDRVVTVSKDKALFCIPLEEANGKKEMSVVFVYAGLPSQGGFLSRQRYDAPRFEGLPLRRIQWDFYVSPALQFYNFGGTLEQKKKDQSMEIYTAGRYREENKALRSKSLVKAGRFLNEGAVLMKKGDQKNAKAKFQQALTYSQGQAELNEDARVQFRNVQAEQFKKGLYNRRRSLRESKNISADNQPAAPLTTKENWALDVVANKLIEQQDAVAGMVPAIRVNMPKHGRKLVFSRELQIDPDADLCVTFWTRSGRFSGFVQNVWPAFLLFAGLLLLGSIVRKPQETAGV